MTHTYHISGMTCEGCQAKVQSKLAGVGDVSRVHVSLEKGTADLTMTRHVPVSDLQRALGGPESRYQIQDLQKAEEPAKSWLDTYKPILVIFGYITVITLAVQATNDTFDSMQWMRHFMAGFFLTFSFFKMLDLRGFAGSYAMYDVVARRFPLWGYLYAFIELALGLANVVNFNPVITNAVTFAVMSVSIIGVLQSVLDKKKIQCACLGAVFNLPMSTVTIIEDALMIAMSGLMLVRIL